MSAKYLLYVNGLAMRPGDDYCLGVDEADVATVLNNFAMGFNSSIYFKVKDHMKPSSRDVVVFLDLIGRNVHYYEVSRVDSVYRDNRMIKDTADEDPVAYRATLSRTECVASSSYLFQ